MTTLLLWIHTDTTVRNQDTGPIIKKDIEMYRINVLPNTYVGIYRIGLDIVVMKHTTYLHTLIRDSSIVK